MRALRLCNPPALQLSPLRVLYGPPLAKEVFSVSIFLLMSIPIKLARPVCLSVS
nr:MAG TPA: hypothetical protein [Caudoviricetes sp.]